MAGKDTTVTDGYGRRVVFKGKRLIAETTDTTDLRKPQWLDLDIWRTEAGAFVVKRAVHHRVAHRQLNCSRLDGYEMRPVSKDDTYPCKHCNPDGEQGIWGHEPRVTVDVYTEPQALINSMALDGKWTRLARSVLADLAEQDERIDALWNTVVVA